MPTKHRSSTGTRPPFVLWREVLVAYAMPAVMAAVGGVATGRPQLVIAALTTIAGTSAVVAAVIGARLRRRPDGSWVARAPRPLLAAGSGLGAAVFASLLGWAGAHWLPDVPALADSPWPGRLRLDLPISATIAATMITWRWRGTRRNP